MLARFFAAVTLVLCAATAHAAVQGADIPWKLPLGPANNWWNTDVSSAPLDASSAAFITFIINGRVDGRQMHPDFGGDNEDEPGRVYGIPYIVVPSSQTKKTVFFTDWPEESDGVNHDTETSIPFYPVPDQAITMNGWIEGGLPGNVDDRDEGDRHILMYDKDNNHLYELYDVFYNGTQWEASSGAFFNLNTNNRRPEGWTSADAAGLAILPGLVRYDETFGPEEIRHAFRVTVRASNGHVFPASHTAGSNPSALPMGARLRLKASKDISGYSPQIQKIFRAMKRYGLIVADNGTDLYVTGSYDTRWNNDILNPAFHSLTANDFEVVQRGWQPTLTFILTLDSPLGAGNPGNMTLTVYNQNGTVNTGYTGTVTFTASGGSPTLPANYTFTPADAGTHTFTGGVTFPTAGYYVVTATDVANATITNSDSARVGPPRPTNVVATGVSATQVDVSWSASAGATQYTLLRTSNGTAWTTVTTTASTSAPDTTALANNAYLYKVRASNAASLLSPDSNRDAATTFVFLDDPLVAGSTKVKAAHVGDLRTAVNALRTATSLTAASFTNPSLAGVQIKAIHIQELRTALAQARAAIGMTALALTDPTINAGSSSVRAPHVQELRNGLQ